MFGMASNNDQERVDVEGIRRGSCTKCACIQYGRRENSVFCICGHTGSCHNVLLLCRGRTNGESCDCQQYRASQFGQCIDCGHQVHDHSGPGIGGVAGAVVGSNVSEALRSMVNDRRASDHERRVEARDGRNFRGGFSGHGGSRPGSGRKQKFSKPLTKRIEVTAVRKVGEANLRKARLAIWLNVTAPFTLTDLKEACRSAFKDLLDSLGGETSPDSDEIYKKTTGLKIEDSNIDDITSICYYYHPKFDALAPGKAKRKSWEPDVDTGDDDDEGGAGPSGTKVQRTNSHTVNVGDSDEERDPVGAVDHVGAADPVGAVDHVGAADPVGAVDHVGAADPVGAVDHVSAADPVGAVEPMDAMYRSPSVGENLVHLSQEYSVPDELIQLLRKYYKSNITDIQRWLVAVCFNEEDKLKYLMLLFKYYAFNVACDDEDDDVGDRVIIKLNRFFDEATVGEEIRNQLREQCKTKPASFNKKVTVRFKDEVGVGAGPRDSYLEIIRMHVIDHVLEGRDDHKLPIDSADLYAEDAFLFAGQMMAHIARHGNYIICGLSEIVKTVLRNGSIVGVAVAMEDIPCYETQVLLKKVLDGERLTKEERASFNALIVDCGLQTSRAVLFQQSSRNYDIVNGKAQYVASAVAHQYSVNKRAAQMMQLEISALSARVKMLDGGPFTNVINAVNRTYDIRHNRLVTLKKHLQKYGIKRNDTTVSPAAVANAIAVEVGGAGMNFGIRMMHKALRNRHRLLVSRKTVATAMAANGRLRTFSAARAFPWNRRLRYCPGPNYRWSEDGHDKLGKYDILIHGCVDEYSRKVMWLHAFVTNRQADIVASYYLDAVARFGVVPDYVISDFGRESTVVAQCQAMFYANDPNPAAHHRWTFSVQNVTVESWWRRLRQLCTQYWINEFQQLEVEGLWSGDIIDRWALIAVYLPLINEDLERTTMDHNSHTIRNQRGKLRPGGQPDDLFNLPEQFGGRRCGKNVSPQEIENARGALNVPQIGFAAALPDEAELVVNSFFQLNQIQVRRQNARILYMQVRSLLTEITS